MASFRPQERGLLSTARSIRDASGWFLGGIGWLTIALGMSQANAAFWPVVFGLFAVVFARRFFRFTLLVEWICLAWSLALLPPALRDWAWLGAICCVLGRVLTHRWSQTT